MGEITIKIPQEVNNTFEIADPNVADKLIADLNRMSLRKKLKEKQKREKLAELSRYLEKMRKDPDADMLETLAIAKALRESWER
jgi:hypothetical protein